MRSPSLRGLLTARRGYRTVTAALDTLAALAEQRGPDPAATKRLRRLKAEQVQQIRQYVATHPGADARVREDVARRGLADVFGWRAYNAGTARDLAVLYFFTPSLDTSALVAARRLYTRGVVTDVISQQADDARRVDPSSQRIAREYLDQTRVIPGTGAAMTWASARTFVERSLAEVAALEADKGPYRTLYTRAMAMQSHFAGAILKLRNPDLHWTAEFSDPLHINAYGEVRQGDVEDDWLLAELSAGLEAAGFRVPETRLVFAWAEVVGYALADEIVFTNDHQRRFMLDYCADPALVARAQERAVVAHQPTLPRSFYHHSTTIYPLADDVVNIGYFGLFTRTRGMTELLDALQTILAPEERARLRLHVFTSNAGELRKEVARRGLEDVVPVRPYVPFLRFLNLTTRFDVLLVNDAHTRDLFDINPYLPSKLSDYLGSGRPIWAVQEPGSVLSSLETAYASELGDAEDAARVLRAVIQDAPVLKATGLPSVHAAPGRARRQRT